MLPMLSARGVPLTASPNMRCGSLTSAQACAQARAAARQERAAKIISLTSLILLLLAVSMYATIVYFGFNPYIAAAALFCAGAAGYPLLAMLTYAVASQTSRSFKRLGPYDRCPPSCPAPSILVQTSASCWQSAGAP